MISTVSLRQSNRKNGKGYLFLDYHPPIKNQVTGRTYGQEYLHMTVYLNPINKEQREHNENTMRQAEEIRSRKAIEMINKQYGLYDPRNEKNDFLAYYKDKVGQKDSSYIHFFRFCNGQCRFGDIGIFLCNSYRNHLINTAKKKDGNKLSHRIPFEQLGLWTSKEGKLSDLGYELLMIGKKYGPNSTNFRNALAYLILTTGHHIDLIHIISEYQKNIEVPINSMEYKKMLDAELTSRGLIGKRKPSAVKTGKKETYLRDEMKLWNKFDLLNIYPRGYFNPGKGYDFNWEKINEVLINGKQW